MDDNNSLRSSVWRGFLIQGLLWGIAIGYTVADLLSETNGLLLFGTTHGNTKFVTLCILVFPAIGLLLGFLMDCSRIDKTDKIYFATNSSRLLIGYTIFYLLMTMLANIPGVE